MSTDNCSGERGLHSHRFVETYEGFVGFGLDRKTDERTIIYYLQKFSDDTLISALVERMSDAELEQVFTLVNAVMKSHLSEQEYHRLFLKEEHP